MGTTGGFPSGVVRASSVKFAVVIDFARHRCALSVAKYNSRRTIRMLHRCSKLGGALCLNYVTSILLSKRTFCRPAFGRVVRIPRVVSLKRALIPGNKHKPKAQGSVSKLRERIKRAGRDACWFSYANDDSGDGDDKFKEIGHRRNAKYEIPVEKAEPRPSQFFSRSLENQSLFFRILEKIRLSQAFPRFHVSQ